MHKTNNLISGRTAIISSAQNSLGGGKKAGVESCNAVIMSGLFLDFMSGGGVAFISGRGLWVFIEKIASKLVMHLFIFYRHFCFFLFCSSNNLDT